MDGAQRIVTFYPTKRCRPSRLGVSVVSLAAVVWRFARCCNIDIYVESIANCPDLVSIVYMPSYSLGDSRLQASVFLSSTAPKYVLHCFVVQLFKRLRQFEQKALRYSSSELLAVFLLPRF